MKQGVETLLQRSWEGAEGEAGSISVGQERKQNPVLTGGWTEAWSGPCTAGVSGPRPLEQHVVKRRGPREHPEEGGAGGGLWRSGLHGTGQWEGGLGLLWSCD